MLNVITAFAAQVHTETCDRAAPLKQPSPPHIRLRSSPKSQVTAHFPHKNPPLGVESPGARRHGTRGRPGRERRIAAVPAANCQSHLHPDTRGGEKKNKKNSSGHHGRGKQQPVRRKCLPQFPAFAVIAVRHRCPLPPHHPPLPPPRRCLTFIFTLQMAGKRQRHCGTARRFGRTTLCV